MGRFHESLYVFDLKCIDKSHHPKKFSLPFVNTTSSKQAYISFASNLAIWHNRLAHTSLPIVKKALNICNVSFNNNKTVNFQFNTCAFGKTYKLPFTPLSSVYAPLNVIHLDF